MTCECGDPDCGGVPDREDIEKHIRESGQMLIVVLGSEDAAPFIYTIGRTEIGQPELLVELASDDDAPLAGAMLNYLGPRVVLPGQIVKSAETVPYIVLAVDPDGADYIHEEFVIQADHYYGRPVDVLCLVPALDWALDDMPGPSTAIH